MLVTIHECKSEGREWAYNAQTTDPDVAVRRAIERYYGRGAYLHRDHGLANLGRYGQIVRDCKGGDSWSATCLTGRVRVDVESLPRPGE